MSAQRPRYAYRVERVTNASSEVHWDPVAKTEVRRLLIEAARVTPAKVSPHARIHSWRWDTRRVSAGGVPK